MREQLRDSSESPSAKYEKLLKQGIAVHKEYESLGKRIGKLYDAGQDDEAEELSEESEQLKDTMSHLLSQRVELVRQMEQLRTIEDAFPRVKRQTKEERKKVDAAELIKAFNAGEVGIDALREAGEQMSADQPEELTDAEMAAFAKRVRTSRWNMVTRTRRGRRDGSVWLGTASASR